MFLLGIPVFHAKLYYAALQWTPEHQEDKHETPGDSSASPTVMAAIVNVDREKKHKVSKKPQPPKKLVQAQRRDSTDSSSDDDDENKASGVDRV